MTEICRRLDGMPLAIELAAARVRALSLNEIVESLHDRFRLLTGGSRTAVRRQQTLRASVDWSHALLTDTERILFRRLAVFLGGFDLEAAQGVAGADGVQRYQVLDQLSLLVDKSLVIAEDFSGATRYRLLETVRQYALEKLGDSGEAEAVRARHCAYYTAVATSLDDTAHTSSEQRIERALSEIDNLRSAFGWCLDHSHHEQALALASAMQPLWLAHLPIREGLAWFEAALDGLDEYGSGLSTEVVARAFVDKVLLSAWIGVVDTKDEAERALALARETDDEALLARALNACGFAAVQRAEDAEHYFTEAVSLARALGDQWRLSQILAWQAYAAIAGGVPAAVRAVADTGRDIAEAIGDGHNLRQCRYWLAMADLYEGHPAGAAQEFRGIADEALAAHDVLFRAHGLAGQAFALAWHGDTGAARSAADACMESTRELTGFVLGTAQSALGLTALAAGDVETACRAFEDAWQALRQTPSSADVQRPYNALAILATGDVETARRWADDAVSAAVGWHRVMAFIARCRSAMAQGDAEQAERDAHDALKCAADFRAYLGVCDVLECLAILAGDTEAQRSARLLGAADAARRHGGAARFKVYDAEYDAFMTALREAMGHNEFDDAWAEGAALSTEGAIAYAQRGRGERKRPATGWDSLTPAEREVVRLVCEGLASKDIAGRLFVSPRTVHAHLSHIYTKLGITSRVQLVQEAARRV